MTDQTAADEIFHEFGRAASLMFASKELGTVAASPGISREQRAHQGARAKQLVLSQGAKRPERDPAPEQRGCRNRVEGSRSSARHWIGVARQLKALRLAGEARCRAPTAPHVAEEQKKEGKAAEIDTPQMMG